MPPAVVLGAVGACPRCSTDPVHDLDRWYSEGHPTGPGYYRRPESNGTSQTAGAAATGSITAQSGYGTTADARSAGQACSGAVSCETTAGNAGCCRSTNSCFGTGYSRADRIAGSIGSDSGQGNSGCNDRPIRTRRTGGAYTPICARRKPVRCNSRYTCQLHATLPGADRAPQGVPGYGQKRAD
jgi:hypothetical protein